MALYLEHFSSRYIHIYIYCRGRIFGASPNFQEKLYLFYWTRTLDLEALCIYIYIYTLFSEKFAPRFCMYVCECMHCKCSPSFFLFVCFLRSSSVIIEILALIECHFMEYVKCIWICKINSSFSYSYPCLILCNTEGKCKFCWKGSRCLWNSYAIICRSNKILFGAQGRISHNAD